MDPATEGVWDLYRVKKQMINSATVIAEQVCLIDDLAISCCVVLTHAALSVASRGRGSQGQQDWQGGRSPGVVVTKQACVITSVLIVLHCSGHVMTFWLSPCRTLLVFRVSAQ
jgi:hypothetical protein